MDFDAKKCVGEIDDSLRKAAYIVPQTKDYEKAIKLLGIDKAISMEARNCEVLSPDRSRSRGDSLGMGL